MKGSVTHALFTWAFGLLAIGGIGLFLSHQWYADDACTASAEWQCSLGDIGFNAAFFVLPLGALVALVAVVTWVLGAMARRP